MERGGLVTLVGAGPGDPGLLTVAGREALLKAEVVLFDRLVGAEILALIPAEAEKIDVGKRRGRHPVPQDEINRLLLAHAGRGRRVVRLKGGDPYLFGRGAEELEELARRGVPFRVVPGVTSAVAVPAYAGIPVTHRDYSSSLHVVSGHGRDGRSPGIPYRELARLGGTLVFLMGASALADICGGLLRAGMAPGTPAALVENGTRGNQRRLVSSLADIESRAREEGFASPAVLIAGAVCALADRFDWTARLPLRGRRLLAAGTRSAAGRLAQMLREHGCAVDAYAAVTLAPNRQPEEFWRGLAGYAWIVFTSPFGVETFFAQLRSRSLDARALARARFAAVGGRTAERLAGCGIVADFVPPAFDSRHLGDGLAGAMAAGETALLFRAREGSDELPEILRRRGIAHREVAAYETAGNPPAAATVAALAAGGYDALAFTCAASVRALSAGAGGGLAGMTAFCLGGMTAAAAGECGLRAETGPAGDLRGLADLILERLGR